MDARELRERTLEFGLRIVRLCQYLQGHPVAEVLGKQLLRCGTSIGANVAEAEKGQSKADFNAKMNIAMKEANETYYWLRLLYRTEYLNKTQLIKFTCFYIHVIACRVGEKAYA